MIKNWKKLFIKYFDFNQNKSVEWWEVIIFFTIFLLMELGIGILSNIIYDKL
jgi:hypothetical protein